MGRIRNISYFEKFIVIVNILVSLLFLAFPQFSRFWVSLQFYFLISLLCINYYRERRLTLFQVWIMGFIFMIQSEMIILVYTRNDISSYALPIFFYSIANSFVLLTYIFSRNNNRTIENVEKQSKKTGSFVVFILFLYLFYLVSVYPAVQENILYGRQLTSTVGSTTLLGSLTTALGLMLPGIIAYLFRYIKSNGLFSLLLVLPIFIVQFLLATRFKFLFSVIPYFIISGFISPVYNSKKNTILILVIGIFLVSISSFMRFNRNSSLEVMRSSSVSVELTDKSNITLSLAEQMSPEGVVAMAKRANDYFDSHDLHYGRESSFLLYFWVPRAIWKSKPYPIDYWLIRETERVEDSYSTASGFLGELRADFGWFSLFFAFLFGLLLYKADFFVYSVFTKKTSFAIVLASMLFPYVFFFVRSPLTASQTFVFELLIYYIIDKLYFKGIPK